MTAQPLYPQQDSAVGANRYQPEPTEGATVAAAGHPITLVSGATVRLRYSMASLRRLEERFGSIAGIDVEIKAADAAMKSGEVGARGPMFTVLSDAIAPGLLHERVIHPDTGAVVRLGGDTELVMEQLDPKHLQAYMDAFAKSLTEAFGSLGKETPAPAAQSLQSSPGGPGSTSLSSPSAAPSLSSGT